MRARPGPVFPYNICEKDRDGMESRIVYVRENIAQTASSQLNQNKQTTSLSPKFFNYHNSTHPAHIRSACIGRINLLCRGRFFMPSHAPYYRRSWNVSLFISPIFPFRSYYAGVMNFSKIHN